MPRLTEADGLTDLQRDLLGAIREFVDAEIIPVASELDHSDTYPDQIVAGLREMGVFGLTIFIVAYLISRHGTAEQKATFLPKMATGEIRAAFSMSEPGLGSDVAAIRTAARRDGADYVISGQKMWITNGASANLVALLARSPAGNEQGAERAHRNLTAFLIEKDSGFGQTRPGLTIPGKRGSTR